MSRESGLLVRRLRAELAEEIERQERDDSARGPVVTVLEQVIRTYGYSCCCAGGCGVEHPGRQCRTGGEKGAMLAAPHPLPLTEHETASAPASELRPWCPPCWRRTVKRNIEIRAELRRQELDEAQTLLFDVERPALAASGGGQ
ncbi:hypothetical protein OG215_42125 (plasmid) [Streptomyces globisporus]|uniref:hypothetical protein n=1 Tax=Streptomyces globisporus TaxID=1908 RepID=UPI00386DE8C1|nr:hypothetical protein OG215_42125 [Streptomyces globisporus]